MPDPTDDDVGEFLEAMKNPPKLSEVAPRLSEVARRASLNLGQAMEREEQRRKDEAERRKAERFRAAVEAYERFGYIIVRGNRTPTYSCPACSAVVRDRERHQRWHDVMNESARKADSAYWHNQPIG